MKEQIINIESEIIFVILLGILFVNHIKFKEMHGFKQLTRIYIMTFIAAVVNVIKSLIKLITVKSGPVYIISGIYSVCVFCIVILLVCFCTECIRCEKGAKRKEKGKLIVKTALLFALTGVLPQIIIPQGINTLTFAVAVSLLILFINLQHEKSITDELTRLPNRYGMDEEIEEQLQQYRKDKTDSFYVIACDMDNFKTINDTWGHAEGDRALKLIADILNRVADRNNAMAFRNGGDEFVIITDKSDKENAEEICEQVHSELEKLHFRDDFKIRMSTGMALFDGILTVAELMKRADNYLYDNKKQRKMKA